MQGIVHALSAGKSVDEIGGYRRSRPPLKVLLHVRSGAVFREESAHAE